jgi:hypothetical protein
MRRGKSQIPKSKFQKNPKSQNSPLDLDKSEQNDAEQCEIKKCSILNA